MHLGMFNQRLLLHLLLLLFTKTASVVMATASSPRPNILFILIDDLGWDDVSFHGSQQIPTPNIDTLAYDGIILNNYYVQPICTPSRSALMSGRHPIHTGLQHGVITVAEPYGLPLDLKILPQYFKDIGYDTHLVGKWHLGSMAWNYTPTERGFDSHYGYLMGKEDYWIHNNANGKQSGLDFWANQTPLKTEYGQYSTEIFTQRAEQIVASHDVEKPLFMYLAHQGVHSANSKDPLQAPWKYLDKLSHISGKKRREFAAMMLAVDDSIGNVTKALAARGMLNNTVIAFSTDNGGPANGFDMNMACNYPLRGLKSELWEGGVRGAGFIWSPLLKTSSYVSSHMMQIFDWFPTLLKAAGYDVASLPDDIDGINLWEALSSQKPSPRTKMLHNIDPVMHAWAVRHGDMKLIYSKKGNDNDGWYGPFSERLNSTLEIYNDKIQAFDNLSGEIYSDNDIPDKQMIYRDHNGVKFEIAPREMFESDLKEVLASIGREVKQGNPVVVQCGTKPQNASTNCNLHKAPCLYNITADPCEYHNVAGFRPDLVASLLSLVEDYNRTAVPILNKPMDPNGLPDKHGGIWMPWL